MGVIVRPSSGFSSGNIADPAAVNADFDTAYAAINGNLDNANIKIGANIDADKLAAASIKTARLKTAVVDTVLGLTIGSNQKFRISTGITSVLGLPIAAYFTKTGAPSAGAGIVNNSMEGLACDIWYDSTGDLYYVLVKNTSNQSYNLAASDIVRFLYFQTT